MFELHFRDCNLPGYRPSLVDTYPSEVAANKAAEALKVRESDHGDIWTFRYGCWLRNDKKFDKQVWVEKARLAPRVGDRVYDRDENGNVVNEAVYTSMGWWTGD